MGMRVCVVDDSSVMRRIHKNALQALGWNVVTAEDGQDALEKLAQTADWDLLVTDLHMPRMDGITLIERVRAQGAFASLKVLMVTSDGVLDQAAKAINAGANDVLFKPFSPEDFNDRVKGLMGG